jgi:GntR family transcriptional regulator
VIDFRLDRASGLPPYLQLVGQVHEALRMGWLKPGDRLPTVRAVVESARVNANTVLKAYRELATSGLTDSRPGAGTFISASVRAVDPASLMKLRGRLDRWVEACRLDGLEDEDIRAIVNAALSERTVTDEGIA